MRQNGNEASWDLRFLLNAAVTWILTAAVLLFPATAILSARGAGVQTMAYVSAGISFFAALAAGAAAGKSRGRGALLTAAVTALALIVCLLTIGFLIRGSAPDPSGVLSVASFTLAGCAVGAVFFSKTGKKTKRRTVRV